MCDVGLLVTQTHGSDKALVFGVSSGEVGSNKCRLSNDSLPRPLVRLLARLDDLEHLLLADTSHLGQRHAKLGGLLRTLVLDGAAEGLCRGRVRSVEQVRGQRLGRLLLVRGLDVALLVGLDGLLHLDLLIVALLLVQLGLQTAEVLGVLRSLVAFTGNALSGSLFVVETAAMQLAPSLHILVLRLQGVRIIVLIAILQFLLLSITYHVGSVVVLSWTLLLCSSGD